MTKVRKWTMPAVVCGRHVRSSSSQTRATVSVMAVVAAIAIFCCKPYHYFCALIYSLIQLFMKII